MRIVYTLYALSGLISLGYQVAWFRIFADRFGSTNLTFGLVVSSFIGGLGVGALASRRATAWMSRALGQSNPLRLYGWIEVAIGLAALLTVLAGAIPAEVLGPFPYHLVGDVYQPTLVYRLSHFAITTLCVFVPCFGMGVTFPLLCSAFREDPRFPATLYGWNTVGACAGVLVTEFVLLPTIGHEQAYLVMAGANVALGAFFLTNRSPRAPCAWSSAPVVGRAGAASGVSYSAAVAASILAGLLTGAFEADVLRRLQFLGCRTGAALSTISFWSILAIFVASFTIRALPRLGLGRIQAGYALALGIYLGLWNFAYPLRDWANAGDRARVAGALPPDSTGLGTEFQFFEFDYGLTALLLFVGLFVFPVFWLLSLLLPWVCNQLQRDGRHLGVVYGANTAAFCAGILAFTVAAPRVNVFYSLRLFLLFFALCVLALALVRISRRFPAWNWAAAAAASAALCAFTPAGFDAGYLPPDSAAARFPVRAMRSDGTHTTYVVGDPDGDLLFFDSHSMSGCNLPSQQYMRLMAHFPLLAHPRPESALLICFGVGTTASAIAAHGSIRAIDVVELNDQVLATAREFSATNRDVVEDPRVRLIHDDGRRFLDLTDQTYDLITSEPPPPMLAGIHRLYSREYYEAARERLSERGLMTQWLPITQMPRDIMASTIATFDEVFPYSVLFVGYDINYILMGSASPIDLREVESRFGADPRVLDDLRRFAIARPARLLARIVKARPALEREFGDEPSISDQHNDFSRAFHDPSRPSVITYDPVALLSELDLAGLECADELRRTVLHLGRLKSVAFDIPDSALESVPAARRGEVALVGIDWSALGRLFRASQSAAAQGRAAESIALMQRATSMTAEVPLMAYWLAMLQTRTRQYSDALSTLRRGLEVAPDDPESNYLAGIILLRLGRIDESVAHLRFAAAADGGPVAAYWSALGDSLAAARDWPAAIEAYDTALARDPASTSARDGRMRCMKELGR